MIDAYVKGSHRARQDSKREDSQDPEKCRQLCVFRTRTMPRDPDPKSTDGFQHRTLKMATLARFQSSLNQTPCFGETCALRMCVSIEKT